jgi:hypothetical protein
MKNKKEIEKRIEELKMIAFSYEDKEYVTENEHKEEILLDAVVTALDELRYFYQKQQDKQNIVSIDIDQGREYAMGIWANVSHRM